MNNLRTMVFHMSDGSRHPITVPETELDGVLTDAIKCMKEGAPLLFPAAKMLFNGAHVVAVVLVPEVSFP